MVQCIVEEDEAHDLVVEVVIFKDLVHLLLDVTEATEIFIKSWVFGIRVFRVSLPVVSEQDRVDTDLLFDILEVLPDKGRDQIVGNQSAINWVNQSISDHSEALVAPQTDDLGFGRDFVYCAHIKPLVDP